MVRFCGPASPAAAVSECTADFLELVASSVFVFSSLLFVVIIWCRVTGEHRNKRLWVRFPGHSLRWILTMCLISVQVLEVTEGLLSVLLHNNDIYLHFFVPCLLSTLASVVSLLVYDVGEVHNSPKVLVLSLIYWTLMPTAKALKLYTFSAEETDILSAREVITWAILVIVICLLCLEMWSLFQQKYLWPSAVRLSPAAELENVAYVHPYTNLLSRSTWSWLTPFLIRGYKKTLQMPDLGSIPRTEHSEPNFGGLAKAFHEEKERVDRQGGSVSLWRCYWKAYWPMVVLGGIFRLLSDMCMFVSPMLIDDIVLYVQNYRTSLQNGGNETTQATNDQATHISYEEFSSNGFVLALIILLSMLLFGIFQQNSFYLSVRQGIRIKAALQALVYEKTLRLPTWVLGEGRMSTGSVMNHMTIDPLNVCLFFYMSHLTWAIVVQMVTIYVLLYFTLGYSAVISSVVMVVIFPVQYFMSERLGKAHERALGEADRRIKQCNEVLQSMKLIKLYAWERIFCASIRATRAAEIRQLLRAAGCRIVALFITDGAPLCALLVTFVLYPHIEQKPMEVGKIFSGLALFSILTLPLYIITMVINITVAACVSTKRLVPFLLAPELSGGGVGGGRGDESRLQVEELRDLPNVKVKHSGAEGATAAAEPLLAGAATLEPREADDAESEVAAGPGDGADAEGREDGPAVEATDASFSWDEREDSAVLSNINIKIPKGKLTVIVGPVGSGKSSLLSALLREMTQVAGTLTWDRNLSVAFGSQKAWLLNASFKENILFGEDENEELYREIVKACSLEADLAMLPAADRTEIGEKGINLSGGQKQRISIARTLYSNADVVILDDPFSALDVHVGSHIFSHAVEKFLLTRGHKTVVLVTHQLQYVLHAHQVIVLEGGKIKHQGSPDKVAQENLDLHRAWYRSSKAKGSDVARLMETGHTINKPHVDISHTDLVLTPAVGLRGGVSLQSLVTEDGDAALPDKDEPRDPARLIEDEEHQVGAVPWSVYLHYARAATFCLSIGTVLAYIVRQVLRLFLDLSLAEWAEAAQSAPRANRSDAEATGNSATILSSDYDVQHHSNVYLRWSLSCIFAGFISISFLEFMGLTAAKRLHNNMIGSVLKAPMRFFDKTPLGRIINRISGDVHTIDTNIVLSMDNFLYCFLWAVTALLLNVVVTPVFAVATLPGLVGFFFVQRFYIASSRELQRLDSITKSPIMSHFSETLSGLATIRAYRDEDRFREKNFQNVDKNNTAFLYLHTTYTWMGIRLNLLSGAVVFVATVCSVASGLLGHISAAMVGLAVTYAMNMAFLVEWFLRELSQMEMQFTSVQRVADMTAVPPEEQLLGDPDGPPISWPSEGRIQFKNVSLRYDEHLDPVVSDINLLIKPGQKVGLCGRTGSGKSSLTLGMFHMIDISQGRILIDDVDVTDVALHTLRSRLAIIPQDPVLFEGTVRYNLDPDGSKSDADVWKALEIAQLKPLISELPSQLDAAVTEGGENFSAGQRQLFCLARAFLRDSRVLVMDEATASIDTATDHVIQSVIQSAFKDRTVITIAHRIGTILSSDVIVLLSEGRVVEHDAPSALLRRDDSQFAAMVHGDKSA